MIDDRMEKLSNEHGEKVLVLYHFVRGLCSSTAESTLIYRRFIQKVRASLVLIQKVAAVIHTVEVELLPLEC